MAHLLPVIDSEEEFSIPWQTLRSIIGGVSIIDIGEVHIHTFDEANNFLKSYGINPQTAEGKLALEEVKDLAIEYLNNVILKAKEKPGFARAISKKTLPEILVSATQWPANGAINWPCLVLKAAHATAHALWSHDSEAEVQALNVIDARLKPFLFEEQGITWIGDSHCKIPLLDFDFKRGKDLFRVVTKLLQKPGNISASIRDRIGLRFVVEDVFCCILLIKFLRSRGIFMYANNIPEETKNSLVEFEQIKELYEEFGPPDYRLDAKDIKLKKNSNNVNPYSSVDFRMIKLIERLLVLLPSGRRTFFSYELQIFTRAQWQNLSNSQTNHDAYEARQVAAVRKRILKRSR